MRTRKRKPHIAIILTLSLVWLILSVDGVAASDWFVRPEGGEYGSEDGTSYAAAYDGFGDINWADFGAGDTLYLAGTFSSTSLAVESGGDSDNDLWIRGDYSGDSGVLSGINLAWSGEEIDYITVYGLTIDGGRIVSSKPISKYNAADIGFVAPDKIRDYNEQFISRGFQSGMMIVCYSTVSNSNRMFLIDTVTDEGDYEEIIIDTVNGDREITDEARDDASFEVWWPITNITIDNCTIIMKSAGSDAIIETRGDYITIQNCELDGNDLDINGAVYISNGENYHRHQNITIKDNYIHNIGSIDTHSSDSHGIGVQGVNNITITGNTIRDCAAGIVFYHTSSRAITNWEVSYNYIENMDAARHDNQFPGCGIVFSGSNTGPYNSPGLVAYNILENSLNCSGATYWGNGIRSKWEKEIKIYDNVIKNYDYAVVSSSVDTCFDVRNNIIIGSKYRHIWSPSAPSSWSEDYNIYYPATATDIKFIYGGYHLNFVDYNANHGGSVNIHSLTEDPKLNNDFTPQSNSPAIDAGVDVGLTQDFEGNPVPQGPAPDIGAYESVVDPNNPTPVLQAIGDKSVDENATLTFNVNATDPNGEAITYLAQSLPSGATLDPQTGDFAWTPSYTQAGSYQVRFIASDSNSNDSETITITVNNVNRAPVLGAISDQSVDENSLLSFSVDATDPDGQALSYSVSGLPTGAVFAGQTFTWTPSYDQAGTYLVTFTADDGQAQDSQTITITVINVSRAPVLTAIGNKSAYADVLLTFTIDASDPDGDAITYSAGTLPSGATFTGQDFDWTPSQIQVGSYAVTFTASDGQLQDSEMVTITVDVDSLAPSVTDSLPTAGSIQVPLNNLITLNIADAGIGVDAATVTIEVNNNIIYTSGASPDGNCQRLGTKADYTFVYQSNEMFDYDQTLTLTVNATDLAGNAMNEHSYSFVTEMRSFGQNKQVNSGLDNNDRPVTMCDSSGNIWAAWHAGSIGNRDIYISKLAVDAENFGSTIQLTDKTTDQCNPAVALDSTDKLYVVWQDNREGDWDIYVSTSVDGISWSTETRVNDPNDGNQVNPAIIIDGQSPNYAHVVWQDDSAGNQDIFITTSSNGFATPTVSQQITFDNFDQVEPAVAADSDNTIYVVWTDGRNGSNDIYGAASNNPWTNVAIVSNTNNQSSPAIAAESTGSILHLLWVDDTSGDNDIYYASSTGLPGSPLTGSSIIDDTSGADQLDPTIAVTGSTDNNLKVFACWQDWRNTDTDLYFAELSAGSGTNVFVGDSGSNAEQGKPVIGIDEYSHPYFIWADNRSTNTDIYYAGSTYREPVALASELVTASASSSTIVGTDPQAITTLDDVSIVVPAGACSYDVTITVTKIANLPAFASPCLGGYDFGPSGIQFSQPVTITIPYVFSSSDGSVTPYWFNSLTGALHQQGITDIQDITISSSLHALSFKATHFTAFFLFAEGGGAVIVSGGGGGGGCSVSASGEGNIVEYILPYIVLAVVMAILKMRDARYRKARNMTTGKC